MNDDNNQMRCDVCGRFISLKELDSGSATRNMVTPDSAFSGEEWETLCPLHSEAVNGEE